MQRSYRLIVSILVVILSGELSFAQEAVYKDVILDGKPAKLNVKTGKITLVNSKPSDNEPKASTSSNDAKEVIETNSDFYVVQKNETLLDIANRYNTSLTELKRINNLESTLVNEGQKLRVKNFENLEYTLVDSPSEPLVREAKNEIHIVEEGQTLYSLANHYGLTINELKKHNGLTSNTIKVGQELRVANFEPNDSKSDLLVWTVKKGDTLYSIAKAHGLTVEKLKNLNGLSGNLIKIGQKLQLK